MAKLKTTPLSEVANRKKELDFKLLDLAKILD